MDDTRKISLSFIVSPIVLPETDSNAGVRMSSEQDAFFAMLYQQYYPRILAYLRFRVGMSDVAEELASQVFERALLHSGELRQPEAAAAWLFRIARNCVVDYFRHEKFEPSLERLTDRDHPHTLSTEESVIAEEERRMLLAYVSHLPEREREIVGLKFVAHLTNREIARVLALPEGTVGSLLYRTLEKLRRVLRTEGDTP